MRTGGCGIQQSLTPEAATIVKQAITLARRRGHAQVTPIHVANVMLASPSSLLRAACLRAHSHPLQCKALELCFNVALNRLATTTPTTTTILGSHSHYPALANALMAAFKRAQAHQRRGSIESQTQPILAFKIETEQLVISILDDPSVSRVMREAGFSSPHVKSNVEHSVSSLEGCSQTTTEIVSPIIVHSATPSYQNPLLPSLNQFDLAFTKHYTLARNEDIASVIESWTKRREKSSVVLVGECLSTCESVVRGIKERAERGDVPLELRYVQFLNCPLLSMKSLSREEIDLRLGEIRCLLKGCVGKGVVLYLGDLRWISEYWAYYGDQRKHCYCPVEHLVMGLRRLVFGNIEVGRLWLMGIATFNSYIKCKTGNPSLETLLDLHPVTIPAGNLDLTLNLDSKSYASGERSSWLPNENKTDLQLTCCTDCSEHCRLEVNSIRKNDLVATTTCTSSSLPSWLQKCKEESISRETSPKNDQETVQIKELCQKWNSVCNSAHKSSNCPDKILNFSSCSPSSSTSISSYDHKKNYLLETKQSWPILFEPKWASKEHQFLTPNTGKDFFEKDPKPELLSNPNSTPNSASSSEATEAAFERPLPLSFTENNPEILDALCTALEKRVPWQRDVIPEIAMTILRIRSGMMSRPQCDSKAEELQKQETWLFFLGMDEEGKLRVAKELAKLIFGSYNSFESLSLSNFSSTRADSTEDFRNKRVRDKSCRSYLETFSDAMKENPHRVFYVEDVEQAENCFQKGIKSAIETGKLTLPDGVIVPLEDAVVIFSCDSFSSASRACSPPVRQKVEDDEHENEEPSSYEPLDLNIVADDDNGSVHSVGDISILESVDKQVFFRTHML